MDHDSADVDLSCPVPGCRRGASYPLKNMTGYTQHMRAVHPTWDPDMPPLLQVDYASDSDNEGEEDEVDQDHVRYGFSKSRLVATSFLTSLS